LIKDNVSSTDERDSSLDEEMRFQRKMNLFKKKLKGEIDFKELNFKGRKVWASKKI
jgi:hypothetical protein